MLVGAAGLFIDFVTAAIPPTKSRDEAAIAYLRKFRLDPAEESEEFSCFFASSFAGIESLLVFFRPRPDD